MRWLIDQGLSVWAARILRDRGVDAIHVSEIGMAAATDAEILEAANLDGRIVATLDRDFPDELAASRATSPSVLLIREERLIGEDVANIIESLPTLVTGALVTGAVVVLASGRFRIRELPIR